MLDDLKYIHEKDQADALGIAAKQADQLRYEFTFEGKSDFRVIHDIVYTGMGGSALAGLLFQTWPQVTEPFEIVRNYELPKYVKQDTLVIVSSYSGNTEETLSALAEAEEKGAQIAVIASGGKLEAHAREKGYMFMKLPNAAQPRYAMLYNFKALLTILEKAGVLHAEDITPALLKAADFVEQELAAWLPTVPTANNPAKQLAQELLGKSVVLYAGPKMYPAAYKMKINVNENAKQIAWVGQLPEFSHNEFLGWSVAPPEKPYAVVDLRSSEEHPRVQKRFEVTARMLSGMRPEPFVVEAKGSNTLEQLLYLVAFGDFVTLYLGILNGLNPAPVDLVEKFKKALES